MVTYKNYIVFSPTHNGIDLYDSNLFLMLFHKHSEESSHEIFNIKRDLDHGTASRLVLLELASSYS
jgi:hypothetical protein